MHTPPRSVPSNQFVHMTCMQGFDELTGTLTHADAETLVREVKALRELNIAPSSGGSERPPSSIPIARTDNLIEHRASLPVSYLDMLPTLAEGVLASLVAVLKLLLTQPHVVITTRPQFAIQLAPLAGGTYMRLEPLLPDQVLY